MINCGICWFVVAVLFFLFIFFYFSCCCCFIYLFFYCCFYLLFSFFFCFFIIFNLGNQKSGIGKWWDAITCRRSAACPPFESSSSWICRFMLPVCIIIFPSSSARMMPRIWSHVIDLSTLLAFLMFFAFFKLFYIIIIWPKCDPFIY